jgi:hypothetical protein
LVCVQEFRNVKWCHPKLRVDVKHLAGGKFLRHASEVRTSLG